MGPAMTSVQGSSLLTLFFLTGGAQLTCHLICQVTSPVVCPTYRPNLFPLIHSSPQLLQTPPS